MYTEHFGLQEQPFGLTPNTQFFLNTKAHHEAFNMLQIALANGEGFIKVVGEVGTGKTMLCRKLLNSLGDDYYTAYIPNPFLDPLALYKALAEELGITGDSQDGINEYQQGINRRLIELVGEGKKVVLVIDEAQALSENTLEALRLISNLETESCKLIHIVLFGQPELDSLLAKDSLRQLRQRISFAYQLDALNESTSRDYIQHRLSTAGYNGQQLFADASIKTLYRASAGVPRLINILCHKALMCAYGKGDKQVNADHVKAAINDTEGLKAPTDWQVYWWGAAGVSVAALLLLLAYSGGLL